MIREDNMAGMSWGEGIFEYLKLCHALGAERGENYFLGMNGPAGIGKKELLRRICIDLDREFIGVDYSDFIENHAFHDMCRDKSLVLFYIGNTPLNNGSYQNEVEKFIEIINSMKNTANVIFVFSSTAVLGTNTAMSACFRVFLYGSLSVSEKLSYARTLIEQYQKKWSLENVYLPDHSVEILIKHYTKEAGINYLSVLIRNLYETIHYEGGNDREKEITITNKMIFRMIGSGCYVFDEQIRKKSLQGIGIAWTRWGGTLLPIEMAVIKGEGNIRFSGNIGNLMKESVQVVFTYLKANFRNWKIPPGFFTKHDFYINIYEQELYKDGASAGLAFLVKVICIIRNIRFLQPIAFSGEISLEGRVLRVGGLKEKLCAVQEHEIQKVVLPKQAWPEYQLLPEDLRNRLSVDFIDDVKELEGIILHEMDRSSK